MLGMYMYCVVHLCVHVCVFKGIVLIFLKWGWMRLIYIVSVKIGTIPLNLLYVQSEVMLWFAGKLLWEQADRFTSSPSPPLGFMTSSLSSTVPPPPFSLHLLASSSSPLHPCRLSPFLPCFIRLGQDVLLVRSHCSCLSLVNLWER